MLSKALREQSTLHLENVGFRYRHLYLRFPNRGYEAAPKLLPNPMAGIRVATRTMKCPIWGRLAVIEVERSILPRGLSSHLWTLWGTTTFSSAIRCCKAGDRSAGLLRGKRVGWLWEGRDARITACRPELIMTATELEAYRWLQMLASEQKRLPGGNAI